MSELLDYSSSAWSSHAPSQLTAQWSSTAFYIATLPLDSAPDGSHRISTELEPTARER